MIEQCVAIVCLTAIELYALHQHINGKLLALVMAVIGGLVGYTVNVTGLI